MRLVAPRTAVTAAAIVGGLFLLFRGRAKTLSIDELFVSDTPKFSPVGSPPSFVPIPSGWRYSRKAAEVPTEAVRAANAFLYASKLGQFDDHETWGLLKEWHFDDHVNGVLKWHPGVTVLVRQTVVA